MSNSRYLKEIRDAAFEDELQKLALTADGYYTDPRDDIKKAPMPYKMPVPTPNTVEANLGLRADVTSA
jgi:hypothetical protein